MSGRNTAEVASDENGDLGFRAVAQRPKPKRKFTVTIGGMEFDKRCTVAEAQNVLAASDSADVLLLLEGGRFRLINDV